MTSSEWFDRQATEHEQASYWWRLLQAGLVGGKDDDDPLHPTAIGERVCRALLSRLGPNVLERFPPGVELDDAGEFYDALYAAAVEDWGVGVKNGKMKAASPAEMRNQILPSLLLVSCYMAVASDHRAVRREAERRIG